MRRLLLLLGLVGCLWSLSRERPLDSAQRGATCEVHETFHANGRLRSALPYEHGRPNGLAREWYPSGELAVEGRYEDGLRVGFWRYYKRDGSLDSERSRTCGNGAPAAPRP